MRVRKIAKQLKRWYQGYIGWDKKNDLPIYGYSMSAHDDKIRHIIRMTKKHYFGLAKKYHPNSMMGKLCIHKACSPYLYDEILDFWCIDADRC